LLRTNILANFVGSGWIALLTLVATPIQIRLLGMEAYGLIGLITVLQIVFGTLDFGLSASVTQTIASDRSDKRSASAPLTNSVASLYALMALVIGVLLWLTAGWIAVRWLQPDDLDRQTVLNGVRAIGIYVAFRWPIAFYTGVLTGIQRMDVLNALKSGAATLRIVVGLLIIAVWPSVDLFLGWFAVSAVLELIAFGLATHRLAPELRPALRFSMEALGSIWKFSLTMAAIALLSMLITQLDRILVSKMLSLEAFGYYSLAYTAGIAISLLQLAINSATLPSFAEAASHSKKELAVRYAKVSELTSFAVALPCFLLIFFASDILRLWVSDQAATNAGLLLALLSAGFLINAVVSNAYLAAVATRKAAIPAVVNAVGLLLYAPMLFLLIDAFGAAGAAMGWAILNGYYIVTLVPAVHRKVLAEPIGPWLLRGLFVPIVVAAVAAGLMKAAAVSLDRPVATWIAILLSVPLYAGLAYVLMSDALRDALRRSGPLAFLPARGAAS
jgi:O-antigen/teichoic acid export membrane protein